MYFILIYYLKQDLQICKKKKKNSGTRACYLHYTIVMLFRLVLRSACAVRRLEYRQ